MLVTFRFQLSPLASSNVKTRAECVSLPLPVQSLSFDKPYVVLPCGDTQVMGQDIKEIPSLFIHNYKLEVIHEFVYLGSTITDNLSIDSELIKRIGKAAMTLSRLTKRVWSNYKLSDDIKVNVYKTCVISTLLHGRET